MDNKTQTEAPPLEGWRAMPDGVVAESQGGKAMPDGVVTKPRRSRKNYMLLPFNAKLKDRAKKLRKAGNLPEVIFWKHVKNYQWKGFDFDRQKIIGNYIVDFYCASLQLVIEIDGSSHRGKEEYDAGRDNFLKGLGLTVIHVQAEDIMKRPEEIMSYLLNHHLL